MHRILLVQEDRKLVGLYKPHLERHFLLDSAHDGLSALRQLRLNRADIIVSDYDLPRLSGLGLLKFVRQHPNFYITPFIFLADHHDTEGALSFGANDWIYKKQANPELVIEKIFHHLRMNKHGLQIHRA